MTEKEVRDTFSDYGIWLNPDIDGEYNNGKGYKCYIRVNHREQPGNWEVIRFISTFYGLEDCEDYLISNYVVDCPAMVKIDLYEDIKYNKELYVRYVPQKQELQLFTNDGEVSYYIEVGSCELVKDLDKDNFDYQLSYFASQLIPNKFYRISDIITDRALCNTNRV